MFLANVYRIMIGCPGDVQEEVQIAKGVINRWTSLHAEQNGVVLLPVNWEMNSYSEQGAHPQKILNGQLVKKSDMLIGIFGSRIGSSTDTAQSGTIEEIEEHIKADKPVMLFFRRINDTSQIKASELAELEAFKESIKNRGLYKEYNRPEDFEKILTNNLELFLADHWHTERSLIVSNGDGEVEFSEEEMLVLKDWVASGNNRAHAVGFIDGKCYIVGASQYQVKSGRDEANWKDFFERMEKGGYIRIDRYNKQGFPVYELQKRAYDQFDNE